jgi:hypothetical protein
VQTHQNAVRDMTVERYLLDELAPLERDEFESHAFGCTECAAELRTAAAFIEATRAVLGRDAGNRASITMPPSRVRSPPGGLSRLAAWVRGARTAPVLAACLVVVVVQGVLEWPERHGGSVQRPGAPASVVKVLSLIGANSRAGGSVGTAVKDGEPLVVTLDIPAADGPYLARLRDPAGATLADVRVSMAEARDTVTIYIPPRAWPAGEYTLVVDGAGTPPQAVTRYRFRVTDSEKSGS